MSQCELFGYAPAEAAAEVVRVIRGIDGWREHFAACGVTNPDLESLAERIDGDFLRGQRRAFKPAEYSASRTPKRRRPSAR
jgi:serine/threonine-protein kinase HipA